MSYSFKEWSEGTKDCVAHSLEEMSPSAVRIKGGLQNDFKSYKGALGNQKPSNEQWTLIIVNMSETCVLNSTPQNHGCTSHFWVLGVLNGRIFLGETKAMCCDWCMHILSRCLLLFPSEIPCSRRLGTIFSKISLPPSFLLRNKIFPRGKKINFSPMD